MRSLPSKDDKIQQICDTIRVDVLAPVQEEAHRLMVEGEKQKLLLIEEGKREKEQMLENARVQIKEERKSFESAMLQATRQAVESLKQTIERKLFDEALYDSVHEALVDPKLVARCVEAICTVLEKEGFQGDWKAYVAKDVKPEEVNCLLAKRVVDRLEGHGVRIGELTGGAEVRLKEREMMVAITDQDVKKLLAEFLRKDFRAMLFG